MDKEYTNIEELLADESFQDFVLRSEVEASTFWVEWASDRPERQKLVEEAQEELQQLAMQPSDEEILDAHQELKNRIRSLKRMGAQPKHSIDELESKLSRKATASSFDKIMNWSPAILATLVILLGGVMLFNWDMNQLPKVTTIETGFGEVLTRRLADGSTITLNGNSKLEIQELRGKYPRRMKLEGEAFFNINNTPLIGARKCEISTSEGVIEVLGTSFNIRDRGDDFEVLLTEGRVNFMKSDSSVMEMNPNDIIVKVGSNDFQQKKANPEMYIAWKDHRMFFKEASIDRVIRRLTEDYGIEVQVLNEAFKSKRINANIKNDDPENLLEALAAIHNLELIQLDSNKYILE